jgi:hypothetical protein
MTQTDFSAYPLHDLVDEISARYGRMIAWREYDDQDNYSEYVKLTEHIQEHYSPEELSTVAKKIHNTMLNYNDQSRTDLNSLYNSELECLTFIITNGTIPNVLDNRVDKFDNLTLDSNMPGCLKDLIRCLTCPPEWMQDFIFTEADYSEYIGYSKQLDNIFRELLSFPKVVTHLDPFLKKHLGLKVEDDNTASLGVRGTTAKSSQKH